MIAFVGKNFFLVWIKLYYYTLTANAVLYEQIHPYFCGTREDFLCGDYTLQEFFENMAPDNKICSPSGVIYFN